MKRKIVCILLSLSVVSSLAACSLLTNGASAASSVANTSTASSTQATSTEYEELTIKTDWEAKADITFNGDDITIEGNGCTNENGVITITEGGAYTLTGNSDTASIVVNTEDNVKIILSGVELTSQSGPVIYGSQVKNLYIELAEGTTNTLTDNDNYQVDSQTGEEIGKGVISCEDDLIILGEGTLNINATHKHGIVSDDKLYVEAGTININSTGTDGIHANDLVSIDGGVITIEAASDIMESEDMLVINGGTIKGTSQDEGLESKNSLYINGGDISIAAEDDGINAASYIEINGGTLSIECNRGDAIDCNGGYDECIVINGGDIYAKGSTSPEGAIDADNSSVLINGGNLIAIGDSNSPISENGEQATIVYGSFTADELIEIKDESGNTIYEYTPKVSGNTLILSMDGLEESATYTIYAAGTETQSFTVDSKVIEAGGSASGMQQGMGGGPRNGGGNFGKNGESFDGQMPQRGQMQDRGQIPELDSQDATN